MRTKFESTKWAKSVLMAFGVLSIMVLPGVASANVSSTAVKTCGQVLSASGYYNLTGNIGPCSGDGIVITASNVHVDLAGFTISGSSSSNSCDQVHPQYAVNVSEPVSGVEISGGTVSGFVEGVVLRSSHSRVSAMTIKSNCLYGVAVLGANNRVETNTVSETGQDGVIIAGGVAKKNVVQSNNISDNARMGIIVSVGATDNIIRDNILGQNGLTEAGSAIFIANGDGNKIAGNSVNGNFNGIFVSTSVSASTIEGNGVNGNVNTGIAIPATSTNSVVTRNRAWGNNDADVSDGNVNCDSNEWTENNFGTDWVAGVRNAHPRPGCID